MAGLKFRVLLDSKDKNEVFRDILVPDNENFENFYLAIKAAFDFEQDQMASFYMSNDNWDKGFEISLFDMAQGESTEEILPGVMNSAILRDYVQDSDQRMILVHDFINIWIFLIELIEIQEETPEGIFLALSVGDSPDENSKESFSENLTFETESEMDEDDDEFGFNDFEDEYDEYNY